MQKPLLTLLFATAASLPVFAAYDVNYPDGQLINTSKGRSTTGVTLSADFLPEQTLTIGQDEDHLLYHDFTDKAFLAVHGSEVTATFATSFSEWMNGYVYIDLNNDGTFDPATELLTQSTGKVINPPAFVIPADLTAGKYRIRFKIDWDSTDPAGSTKEGNDIISNEGSITDAILVVNTPTSEIAWSDNHCTTESRRDDNYNLILTVHPDEGYTLEDVTVKGGYDFMGMTPLNDALSAAIERTYYPQTGKNNVVVIPGHDLVGGFELTVNAVEATPGGADYAVVHSRALEPDETIGAVTVNGSALAFSNNPGEGYFRASRPAAVGAGSEITVTYAGAPGQTVNFYLDKNQDGEFMTTAGPVSNEKGTTVADGAAYSSTLTAPNATGVYRGRVEIEGNYTADFFVSVNNGTGALDQHIMNGIAVNTDGSALANSLTVGRRMIVSVKPTLPGFVTDTVIIRHGHNLDGPELINGNPQWADYKVTRGAATGRVVIPADIIDGDVTIIALFEQQPDSEWEKIWGDEFSKDRMNSAKWVYQSRSNATWARFVAKTDAGRRAVNIFENGYYNSYATAYDGEGEESDFISGAINSQSKFSIRYGKIEARIKTTAHTGNFPAFWMMPAEVAPSVQEAGLNTWPVNGEIDIWEQINEENRSYHTIHSGWSNWQSDLQASWAPNAPWPAPKTGSPAKGGNKNGVDASLWHVYALEWDAEELRWYVDGEQVFSYANQHYNEEGSDYYFEDVTWPFNKKFYIILNQSTGNGSWAANVDKSFTYLTQFDYVRVYTRKGDNSQVESVTTTNGDDPEFYVPAGGLPDIESSIECIAMPDGTDAPAILFDLNGRRVGASPRPGIYVEKRGDSARKLIIR